MTASMGGNVSVVEPALDEKLWGGRKLADYGLRLPEHARIGEALVTADNAAISSGMAAGRTLGDVVRDDRGSALGTVARAAVGNRDVFPLLVKLIDASENLSIQVHPNDEQAAPHNRLGKTEAWHVLSAVPGSCFYVGLQNGVSPETFLKVAARADGSSADLLRKIPAQPGTTILLPAGTVHALGAGVMVYEIQQPSDITYRLDDWGRLDANGSPREMHLEAGVAAMRPDLRPDLIAPVELPSNEGRRHLLVACRKFALEWIALPGGGRYFVPGLDGPQVLTVLSGAVQLGEQSLAAARSGVVWPSTSPAILEASVPSVVLRGWVPDLVSDLEALAATPGIDRNDLRKLCGPLPDIQQVLDQ